MSRKAIALALVYAAAVMWWVDGSWSWGAAALLHGLSVAWICSPDGGSW